MRTDIIIVDDFYIDVEETREFALKQDFSVTGNFPGARTVSFTTDETKRVLQEILHYHAGAVMDEESYDNSEYTGAFQLCTAGDTTWVHSDPYNTWAGIVYLTPDAPLRGGTGFFRHKKSGEASSKSGLKHSDATSMTKWEQTDEVANVFNRLVLYRGDLFHAALDYFGSDKKTGRLTQVFFLTTAF